MRCVSSNIRSYTHKISLPWLPKQELNKLETKGRAQHKASTLCKKLYIAEESWGQERWSSPGKGKPVCCPAPNSSENISNIWTGQVMVRCRGGVHAHWHLTACVGVRGQTTCGQIPGIKLSCQAWSQEPLPAELYCKVGKWCRMHASKAVFSTCGARPHVEQHFHRGRLRPQENTNIYIMIHSSSKVTVMKQ